MPDDAGAFAGRSLSQPSFPDDTGVAPPALAGALSLGDPMGIVSALLEARVLVPVVAVLADPAAVADDRVASRPVVGGDKEADMAVVTVRAPSGRLALPVFSSVTSLAAWSSEARPVPVPGVLAARAAYDEGAEALLIDPAGPSRAVLDGALLRALAEGREPVAPLDDPEVHAAVASAAAGLGLAPDQVRLEPRQSVDLVVRLTLGAAILDEEVADVARALGAALAADPVVRSRLVRGLDLAVERQPLT